MPAATMKIACAVLVCFIGVLIFKDAKRLMSNGLRAPLQDESFTILPGTGASWGSVARAIAKAAKGHTKNKRPSTKGKHQKGDARRGRDQKRANDKKQKGGKDGSKKRGGKG